MNLGYALSVAVFFGSVWICNDQLLQFSVWGIGLLVEQLPMLIFEAVAQQQGTLHSLQPVKLQKEEKPLLFCTTFFNLAFALSCS